MNIFHFDFTTNWSHFRNPSPLERKYSLSNWIRKYFFFPLVPCHDDFGHCQDKPQTRWTLAYLTIVFRDDEPNAVFGIALAET